MNTEKVKKIMYTWGINIELEEMDLQLPIAFALRYDICVATFELKELRVLLIKEKRRGSIESFITQCEKISQLVGLPYCLLFTEISNETQKLLLKARIPFLDYKGNMFLPELGLILKKKAVLLNELKQNLSPSEQAILIYLLLNQEKSIQVKAIEKITGVSIPSIYRILKKFVEKNWIISSYNQYQFAKTRVEIYKEALPLMKNPMTKRYFIQEEILQNSVYQYNIANQLMISGIPALSKFTMLDSFENVYAISDKKFREMNKLTDDLIHSLFEQKILNHSELQIWKYQPFSLDCSSTVDPISLFLSLKNEHDPRVEIERNTLENNIMIILEENDANK